MQYLLDYHKTTNVTIIYTYNIHTNKIKTMS